MGRDMTRYPGYMYIKFTFPIWQSTMLFWAFQLVVCMHVCMCVIVYHRYPLSFRNPRVYLPSAPCVVVHFRNKVPHNSWQFVILPLWKVIFLFRIVSFTDYDIYKIAVTFYVHFHHRTANTFDKKGRRILTSNVFLTGILGTHLTSVPY